MEVHLNYYHLTKSYERGNGRQGGIADQSCLTVSIYANKEWLQFRDDFCTPGFLPLGTRAFLQFNTKDIL